VQDRSRQELFGPDRDPEPGVKAKVNLNRRPVRAVEAEVVVVALMVPRRRAALSPVTDGLQRRPRWREIRGRHQQIQVPGEAYGRVSVQSLTEDGTLEGNRRHCRQRGERFLKGFLKPASPQPLEPPSFLDSRARARRQAWRRFQQGTMEDSAEAVTLGVIEKAMPIRYRRAESAKTPGIGRPGGEQKLQEPVELRGRGGTRGTF
jgi:hypothetical protein